MVVKSAVIAALMETYSTETTASSTATHGDVETLADYSNSAYRLKYPFANFQSVWLHYSQYMMIVLTYKGALRPYRIQC